MFRGQKSKAKLVKKKTEEVRAERLREYYGSQVKKKRSILRRQE